MLKGQYKLHESGYNKKNKREEQRKTAISTQAPHP